MNKLKMIFIPLLFSIGLISNGAFAQDKNYCLQVKVENDLSEVLTDDCFSVHENVRNTIKKKYGDNYKTHKTIKKEVKDRFMTNTYIEYHSESSYFLIEYIFRDNKLHIKYKDQYIHSFEENEGLNLFNIGIFKEQFNIPNIKNELIHPYNIPNRHKKSAKRVLTVRIIKL